MPLDIFSEEIQFYELGESAITKFRWAGGTGEKRARQSETGKNVFKGRLAGSKYCRYPELGACGSARRYAVHGSEQQARELQVEPQVYGLGLFI